MIGRILMIAAIVAGGMSSPAAARRDGGFPGNGWSGGYAQMHQLVCASVQFRPATCPTDARGGVRLLQQTGGVCIRGQTWGFTARGVWVDNGCRAIFAVIGGRPGDGPAREVAVKHSRSDPRRAPNPAN